MTLSDDTLAREKAELRRRVLDARAAAHASQPDAAGAIAEHFLSEHWPARGGVVASYRPIGSEASPAVLEAMALERGLGLGLPVMRRNEDALDFRAFAPGDRLEVRAFGVAEPALDAPVLHPDLVFAPLVAADLRGGRLGYGKGYYDRSLAALRAAKPVRVIGIAFEEQIVEAVPTGAFDERLDALLTPSRLVRFD